MVLGLKRNCGGNTTWEHPAVKPCNRGVETRRGGGEMEVGFVLAGFGIMVFFMLWGLSKLQ